MLPFWETDAHCEHEAVGHGCPGPNWWVPWSYLGSIGGPIDGVFGPSGVRLAPVAVELFQDVFVAQGATGKT